MLKRVLDVSIKKETVVNGFSTTGLLTLNADDVDFSKVIKSQRRFDNQKAVSNSQWLALRSHLFYLEEKIGEGKLGLFKKGEIQRRDESLFDLWTEIKEEVRTYGEALENSKTSRPTRTDNNLVDTAPTEGTATTVVNNAECGVKVIAIGQSDVVQSDTNQNEELSLTNIFDLSGINEFPIELDLPVDYPTDSLLDIQYETPNLEQTLRPPTGLTTPNKILTSTTNDLLTSTTKDPTPSISVPNSASTPLSRKIPTSPSLDCMTPSPIPTPTEQPTTSSSVPTQTPLITTHTNSTPKSNLTVAELKSKVPSPFKRALFWPGETQKSKKYVKRIKLPSAITSEEWKEYYKKKEEDKKVAAEEKERKKLLREAKAKIKNESREQKGTKCKRKVSEKEDMENEEDEPDDNSAQLELPDPINLNVNELQPSQWVDVPYDLWRNKKLFVGQIISINKEDRTGKIKFLEKKMESGKFIWPTKDDVDTVPLDEIVQYLREPTFDRWGYLSFEDLINTKLLNFRVSYAMIYFIY
ncbi:hypothetical protein J6590_013385 [Homalodisca vitripennis]|nr:hypothetical protein J6590_013385 [Homalodisca vitripennis]